MTRSATPDQFRLDRAAAQPRALALWRAVHGLRSPLRFMMSGAHPDDEAAPLMAALHFRDGLALSYACATRGEGGQNDLGTERGADLGALRTAEMEAACDVLNMRLYWLSQSPDDSITDWRFSKSGSETLEKWGHARCLARMVHILRRDRPDILCPTFLDVPGQHGHHRAMTRIAHEAFEAAADPGFTDSSLAPWPVAKLYLPAWSGMGRAYDDDLPPPPATLNVSGAGADPFTGWSYALIGAMSHGAHRSQGMGRWPDEPRDYPLHLAQSRVGADMGAISDNLPANMDDLGVPGFDAIAAEMPSLIGNPARLDEALGAARAALDAAAPEPDQAHRIALKRQQIARLRAINSGLAPQARRRAKWLRPGESAEVAPEATPGGAQPAVPDLWRADNGCISPAGDCAPDTGYRDSYDPQDPPRPALRLMLDGDETFWPMEGPALVAPARELGLGQTRLLVNRAAGRSAVEVGIETVFPEDADVSASMPEGWTLSHDGAALRIALPVDTTVGRYHIPLLLNDAPAYDVRRIAHPHIAEVQSAQVSHLDIAVIDAPVPPHPVGYLGGGLDTVAPRLRELGVDLQDLGAEAPDPTTLQKLPSLIVGIHALKTNPGLAGSLAWLHDWVRAGGTLVTLYHRPWDNWSAANTGLDHLEIGQPSLRWRVTHADAPVRILCPDDAALNGVCAIGPEDFAGWTKERGLYFAKSWGSGYRPLLELSDPDEPPLSGGLLSGEFGSGRHIHCALNLHHQIEHGIPGAIRLAMSLLTAK